MGGREMTFRSLYEVIGQEKSQASLQIHVRREPTQCAASLKLSIPTMTIEKNYSYHTQNTAFVILT